MAEESLVTGKVAHYPGKKILDVLAIVLHPVFLFFYGFVIMLLKDMEEGNDKAFLLAIQAFIFGLIIPVAFSRWWSKDIYLSNRKQRIVPIAVTFLSIVSLAFLIVYTNGSDYSSCRIYTEIGAANLFFMLLISLGYKISLHANSFGIWSMLFILFYLGTANEDSAVQGRMLLITLPILLLFFLVMWQRVASKAHPPLQVILGFVSGMLVTLAYVGFLAEIF